MSDVVVSRQRLLARPEEVLSRLPSMGRIMIVAQTPGVTLERIGIIERVEKSDDKILCLGEGHDCVVDVPLIASVAVDRSSRMQGKVLPKIEFLDAQEESLFGAIGLDGLEGFDSGIADLPSEALQAVEKKSIEPAELADDDIGAKPLNAASKADAKIAIEMHRRGLHQRWRGRIPRVNPAMGFINIIKSDFHLHLRGGAVARWDLVSEAHDGELQISAIGQDGKATGLVLSGTRTALGLA